VAKADLTLAVADAMGKLRLDARLQASDVKAGTLALTTLSTEANGPLNAIAFSATTKGTLGDEPLAATLAGTADAGGAVTTVALINAEASVGQDTARLRQPLDLRIGNGSIEATGLDLALPGDGSLTGEAAQHPGGYAGNLTLAGLPLELLQRRAGAPFAGGALDARAVFDTRSGRARADLSAQAHKLNFSRAQAGTQAFDLDATATWDGARLDTDATATGSFGQPLHVRLALPLRPGRDGIPQVQPGGTLDGGLAWSGDIGDLWALVPAPGHILDGFADIDLKIGGTLDAPRVAGKANLDKGEYQNLAAGTILTDLTLRTTVAEDGTVRLTLDGSDGAKGKVSVTAAVGLGRDDPTVDASARIRKATLIRRDDVIGQLSGDLTVSGALSQLRLGGRIHIDKAEVRLVDASPPELVDLEGIRIKGAPEPPPKRAGDSRVTLDVTVAAERDIFARGRGLDSEWKMDLAVTGDAAAPVVTGKIEKVRGELSLLGRTFELVRGQIVFDGGRTIDPLLDVSLEREENDIRGGITVTGRALTPELHFVSTPPLPEDEVLPQLLFGRSKQSLSGAEALQLATGLATLTSGRAGPLDKLRSAAGLDVLRFEGDSAETASVTVGRNIAKGVFVGARQGLGEQGGAVAVEVEVFDGIVVDTEVGQTSGADIGITLRKDF